MFSWKKLFGGGTENTADEARNTANNLAAQEAEPIAFLRRDPVFDRQNRLAGHLFCLQQASLFADAPSDLQRQIDARLLAILVSSNEAWNAQPAFLPIGSAVLDHAVIDRLPGKNICLLIQLAANDTDPDALAEHIQRLRQRGVKLGFFRQPRHPLFALAARLADLGTIDVASSDAGTVRDFSAAFRAVERIQPAQLFAANIDTLDDHGLCQQWHFEHFHGAFATNAPPPPGANPADPHKVQLLNLLRLVQGEAETAEIAEAMKQDPLLTFRILRYLNSPALGLTHPIDSIGHALIILGRQRLTRWLSVLLFSVREPNFADWILVESALTRGRLMEELGTAQTPPLPHDPLFLTGIFSCLGRLLHRPLADILDTLPIAEDIRRALLERSGPLAPLLAVAEASEAFDIERMRSTALAAGLDPAKVNHALLAATAWASEVTEHWE